MKVNYALLLAVGLLTVFTVNAQDSNGRYYSAGEIQSKVELLYGRFEMRMYSSDVSGTTSTFFLWKNGGEQSNVRWNELDIETFGKDHNTWQSNPIWQYNDQDQELKRWEGFHSDIPIANTWVKFALEWTPDYIAWFNNDVEVRRIVAGEDVPSSHWGYNNGNSQDPVDHIADPMRIAFNHWATFPGDWLGPFNPADLPSYQFVDWFTYQPWNGNGFDPVEIRMDFNDMSEVENDFYISRHTFGDNQCTFTPDNVGVTNGMMWLSITGYQDARPPQGDELPEGVEIDPIIHQVPNTIYAEEYSAQSGLQLEDVDPSEGTGRNLGWTDAGDYVDYEIEVLEAGEYTIDFRVASSPGGASFGLQTEGQTLVDRISVEATGGWQSWTTVSETISLEQGVQTLRIVVLDAGFNLYRMDIAPVGLTTNQALPTVQNFKFYPNPVIDQLRFNQSVPWRLLDLLGRRTAEGYGSSVNMDHLRPGVYLLQVSGSIHRVIKE